MKYLMEDLNEYFKKREVIKEKERRLKYQNNANDFLKNLDLSAENLDRDALYRIKLEYDLYKSGVLQHNQETGKLEILKDSPYFSKNNMSCDYIDDKRPCVINAGKYAPLKNPHSNDEYNEKMIPETQMKFINYEPGYFGPFRAYGNILPGQELDPEKLMDTDTL